MEQIKPRYTIGPDKYPFVIPTPEEISYACSIGSLRFNGSKNSKKTFNPGCKKNELLDQIAACAELAFCIIKGIKWPANHNKCDGSPDAPPIWEVKCTEYSYGYLPIRINNNPERKYALITYDWKLHKFTYRGWRWGYDIRLEGRYLEEVKIKNYPAAHCIKQDKLIKDWPI